MKNTSTEALDLLARETQALADEFARVAARYAEAPAKLMESIAYSFGAGGKRLRPALVMECCRACAGDANALASSRAAALAMELIHTFSLVHDDLPAMDDDDLRRGRPTNHKVYGEAMAILAGDAMTTLAFEVLSTDAHPSVAVALIRELATSAGPLGMIGGQVLDIEGENQSLDLPSLQRLHRMKTGALLTASCRLGALAAGAGDRELRTVTTFGQKLGLAFQIIDDVLDVTSSAEKMGKATGKDAAKGKNTYPALLGLPQSKAQAATELHTALETISLLGPAAKRLKSLAKFVVEREN